MKKLNEYKKMSAEQVQELLYMRKRHYVAKNKKAYSRKEKHKKDLTNDKTSGKI